MDTVTMEQMNGDEIINILSDIIQKQRSKIYEGTGKVNQLRDGTYTEQ